SSNVGILGCPPDLIAGARMQREGARAKRSVGAAKAIRLAVRTANTERERRVAVLVDRRRRALARAGPVRAEGRRLVGIGEARRPVGIGHAFGAERHRPGGGGEGDGEQKSGNPQLHGDPPTVKNPPRAAAKLTRSAATAKRLTRRYPAA